jgi:transposase
MTAISNDLRERIVARYLRGGESYESVAEHFSVGRATVNRVINRHRKTGSVEPSPHGGGNPARIVTADFPRLAALVAEHPDWTVAELAAEWRRVFAVALSRSSMQRALLRAGFTLKKSHFAPPSRTDRTSKKDARSSGTLSLRSTPRSSFSSTSRAATRR